MTDPAADRPSLGKVYDAINEVRTDVAVIKADITDIKDHEHRLRVLERRSWSLAGIATLGGAGLSQIVSKFLQ